MALLGLIVVYFLRFSRLVPGISSQSPAMDCKDALTPITDVTINFCTRAESSSSRALDPKKWRRVEKDLYLQTGLLSAWLHLALATEEQLYMKDHFITDIRISEQRPTGRVDDDWESRPGGIWILRSDDAGHRGHMVTGVDILFGTDAVDPRPQWTLLDVPLQLNASPDVPAARLSVRYGVSSSKLDLKRETLRAKDNGKFKILQISDTHMVTDVGVCNDASDAQGQPLPESEADPLTVEFLGRILDVEKPDLVILTGDQVHHDVPDTRSALYKVVAPLSQRSIPFAPVFGNHDSEGAWALSRLAQMQLLQDLPFSLARTGPEDVDGVGNYHLQVFAPTPSKHPALTLYLLDSHGQTPSTVQDPDYGWIMQSQIDWFACTSQALRKEREQDAQHAHPHVSLAFMHIPLPEFGRDDLVLRGGQRREPTEGPSFNSRFYDALVAEGVAAVGCGHDHVNDFCALLPQPAQDEGKAEAYNGSQQQGPWLCYGGGAGFGGYCSYDGNRYHRRMRVWEVDTGTGAVKTWKRVEYADARVDELVLVEGDAAVAPSRGTNGDVNSLKAQVKT